MPLPENSFPMEGLNFGLKPSEYGSVLTLAEGQGITVQYDAKTNPSDTINTRLRLGHGADPYTIRFTNSNKIRDLGMFSGNGVIRFRSCIFKRKTRR